MRVAARSRLFRFPLGLLAVGAFFASSLFSSEARAGAWTKPAGGGYLKLGTAAFGSDHAFDLRGERVESGAFFLHAETLYAYAEVGLTDDITLIGLLPYVVATNAHQAGVRFHTFGFGDALLGTQIRILDLPLLVSSARFEMKLPLYEGAPSVQGRQSAKVPGFPRSATLFPALGDGQVDLAAYLSVGSGLAFVPLVDAFVTVDVGYRLRSGPLTDAVLVNATGGVWVWPGRALLMGNAVWVASLPSRDERRVTVGKGYLALGPALMVPLFAGLSFEAGFDLVTAGVNTAGGMQALLGVSYAF